MTAPRHKTPLTPAQWTLIVDVERLCWKLARRHTPDSLRHRREAVEESYDRVLDVAINAARTFDPANGAPFTTYFGRFVKYAVWKHWMSRPQPPLSLETPAASHTPTPLRDLLPAPPEPPHTTHEDLDALRFLPPRQLQALALTYGLNGDTPRTSETVGKLMGCSAQNVRGLALNALARLRKRMGVLEMGKFGD